MNTANKAQREQFIQGYWMCALWSSVDTHPKTGKDVELDLFGFDEIDPATYTDMVKDCNAFMDQNSADLAGIEASQAGHDFWLTRCGHGAGFWDRDLGEVGDRLTASCKQFGNVDLYIGDDMMIYQ